MKSVNVKATKAQKYKVMIDGVETNLQSKKAGAVGKTIDWGFFVSVRFRPFILTNYFSIKYRQFCFRKFRELLSFTIFSMVCLWLA